MILSWLLQEPEAVEAAVAVAAAAADPLVALGLIELLVPAVVSALVIGVRQFSASLDGPAAYWWALGLNVVGQVIAELIAGDGGASASAIANAGALGIGTGATVSVGVATAGKRLGLKKLITPRPTG